jgi:hypothetical protein
VGDWIVVSACNPSAYNTLNNTGMVQATSGTTGTTIKYPITSNPGSYVSGCRVFGPGSANGVPNTTGVYTGSGNMTHEAIIQGSCNGTYCYFISSPGDFSYSIAGRIDQVCLTNNPQDSTCRQVWTGPGETYSSTVSAATPLTCYAGGISQTCGTAPSNNTVWYVSDSSLPDGGRYFTFSSAGQSGFMHAAKPYGPWFYEDWSPLQNTSATYPPVNLLSSVPSLWVSGGSTAGCVGSFVARTGTMFHSTYSPLIQYICLGIKTPSESLLFNQSPTQGHAGYGNQFQHIQSGLIAFWDFTSYADILSLQDKGPNKLNLPISAVHSPNGAPPFQPQQFISSYKGLENPNSALNTGWYAGAGQGGNFVVDTTFNQGILSTGDFTTGAVFASTATGTQYLMSGTTTGNVGFAWKIVGTAVHFTVRNGASIDVTCPGTLSAGTMTAYIGMRYNGVGYCFRQGTTAPATAGSDSASLGTYTLSIGSFNGGTTNYLDGEIGGLYIWNRALCSTQIPGTCSAGQADEVQGEFSAMKAESATRGWGF